MEDRGREQKRSSRVAVLGAGAFGTALALHAHRQGCTVRVWSHEASLPARVAADRENAPYLEGVPLPADLVFDHDLKSVLEGADLVLFVVPAQFVRAVAVRARPHLPTDAWIGCCAKGIEHDSLALMSAVLEEVLPEAVERQVFLSGPTFARELAEGRLMDITAASRNPAAAEGVQCILHASAFRVYTSDDPIGVEVAGALKNVIAIACGAVDELGLGLSARGSLIARGLAEMARIGVRLGAHPVTFLGLSGVGDLVLTCTGDLSRNRTLGRQIARGERAKDILARQAAIAEGYYTAGPAHLLAERLSVDAPIIEQVHHVLQGERSVEEALARLVSRESKSEFEGIL